MSKLETMSREQRRAAERMMKIENARWPLKMTPWPREQWPEKAYTGAHTVFRSREFMVQVFDAKAPSIARLSINRTALDGTRWQDGISWDELQRIKNECGFTDYDAVEVFPTADTVVNVANMRHLWVVEHGTLAFKWGAA